MVPAQVTRKCIKKTEIINVETHPSVLVENLIKVPIEPKPLSHTLMHGLCTNPLGHAVITLCFTCPISGPSVGCATEP